MRTFEVDVVWERPSAPAVLVNVLVGLVLNVLGVVLFRHIPILAAVVLGAGAFFLRGAWALRGERGVTARLLVDEEAIELTRSGAEVARVERRAIKGGMFVPNPGSDEGTLLLLGHEGEHRMALRVPSATGAQILEALDLDVTAHRARFEGVLPLSRGKRILLFGASAAIGFGTFAAGVGPVPMIVVMALVALLFAWPSTIELGADGISIKTPFRTELVRFRDIRSIEEDRGRIAAWLVLHDGRRVAVPAIAKSKIRIGDAVHEEGSNVLRDRLRNAWVAAIDVHRGGPGAKSAVKAMGRGARSAQEWVDSLRSLRERGGYRANAIPAEILVEVLEDTAAPDDARAAAAFVLAKDGEASRRIRIAADATASPKLRIALEAACGTDDEAAVRALEDLGRSDDDEPHLAALTMKSRSG